MTANSIARLKVTLNDVKPPVQRRVEVPLAIRLDRLHLVLQAAIGWTNSHLYEIRARDDAKKARLIDVLEDAGVKTVKYLYDFGDGWEHTVKVERITDAIPGLAYPVLIDATGRCPPEDVGGPWGYDEFLDALADPAHENHAETAEWIGDRFDPKAVDVRRFPTMSRHLPRHGPANRPPSARDPPNPRPSPDGYGSEPSPIDATVT